MSADLAAIIAARAAAQAAGWRELEQHLDADIKRRLQVLQAWDKPAEKPEGTRP